MVMVSRTVNVPVVVDAEYSEMFKEINLRVTRGLVVEIQRFSPMTERIHAIKWIKDMTRGGLRESYDLFNELARECGAPTPPLTSTVSAPDKAPDRAAEWAATWRPAYGDR